MAEHSPITPTPELVQQWMSDLYGCSITPGTWTLRFAARAAQWGADQELEACCEWLDYNCPSVGAHHLRAARRPKPPSLKEQALEELDKVDMLWATEEFGKDTLNSLDTIRRAIESIPDPS